MCTCGEPDGRRFVPDPRNIAHHVGQPPKENGCRGCQRQRNGNLKTPMSGSVNKKTVDKSASKPDVGKEGDPEWTSGLKRLYDSVLDEPLPDTFNDLLSKLDQDGGK